MGGLFTSVDSKPVNYIARWDGSSWSSLGSGMNSDVYALAVSGTNLYVGGGFTRAGGLVAYYIAKWDGNSWSALGSGMIGVVHALAISGSNLYAGGDFTTAGGSTANYVAKWDGGSWSALGLGLDNYVYALAVSDGNVYAGGQFTKAGGSPANHIAKWDGSNWAALDSGVGGIGGLGLPYVFALAASGANIYVGGGFTTAGGTSANCIARWDGSGWTGLGSGMGTNCLVNALAIDGPNVYAAGYFTNVGGIAANSIAKWDGTNWSVLGSGILKASYPPYTRGNAVAVSGNRLYAGGYFSTAGSAAATNIARAYLTPLPTLSLVRSGLNMIVSWPSTNTSDFTLEQADTLNPPPSWVSSTATVGDDGTTKSATFHATNGAHFFHLRGP
jgi:hypothetical protein